MFGVLCSVNRLFSDLNDDEHVTSGLPRGGSLFGRDFDHVTDLFHSSAKEVIVFGEISASRARTSPKGTIIEGIILRAPHRFSSPTYCNEPI
jgi:hypothetical protein